MEEAGVTADILEPYWYQGEAIDNCFSAWDSGFTCIAVDHATGLGKTVVMSHVTKRYHETSISKRVALFVNRDFLVKQARKKLHAVAPHLTVGVVKAKRVELDADVVIISIQTITRVNRLHEIPPDYFGLILIDECHHTMADGYLRALDYFGAPARGTKVLGVTATFGRADSRKLGTVYQKVVDKRDILFGIRHGFLVPPVGKRIQITGMDLSGIPRSAGDFTQGKLGEELEKAHYPAAMARAAQLEGPDRQGVFYFPSIATAEQFRMECLKLGMTCDIITGATDEDERDAIDLRLRSGETQHLSNVSVATEGWDLPQISMVGASPTENPYKFMQEVGRGIRTNALVYPESPYPWMRKPKTDCLVLMSPNTSAPNLVQVSDLSDVTEGVEVRDGESLTDAVDRHEKIHGRITGITTEDVDLMKQSPAKWFRTRQKGWPFLVTEDWLIVVLPEDTRMETYVIGRVWNNPRGKARQRGGTVMRGLTMEYAMAQAVSVATELDPKLTFRSKDAGWRKRKFVPRTAEQEQFCKIQSIVYPDSFGKVELSDHITRVMGSRKLDNLSPKTPEQIARDRVRNGV